MKKFWMGVAAAALLATSATAPASAAKYMPEHRGGTLKIVAHAAAGTLDPHINYTLQYWQIYQGLYDGLVSFKKAAGAEGFVKVPDLAEAIPAPTNDGKTYVFKLRKGIKFSNGNEVTVKDVVASFQRIFKVSSPTAGGFYSVLVGADACLKDAKSCTLEGGVTGNEADNTITINLTRPDAEFIDKLGLPHAVILPADAPTQDAGSIPIPGTGAYMVSAYDPNKGMTMVRNPNFKVWSEDAQPDGYPDTIQYDFGPDEEAQITAIENGDYDWAFDEAPADRLGEMGTKFKDQVHVTPLTAWWYLPMNTNLPPFDNIKARQAINYAIDRKQLVNLFGGPVLASPVCQVLPPGFPGHEDYCPYTKDPGTKWSAPDMEKAKKLVEESGTKGAKVTIIAEDKAVSKAIGVYLQSLMKDLGYDVDVKPISPDLQFTYIQNTNNKVQMSITQWYQDYPAASDFLNILFGCASFTPGSDSSINISGWCDKGVQAKMDAALALGVTDQAAANKAWAEIDKAVTDASPAAALFTPKHLDFTSKRLGNFQFNSEFYFAVSQAWVK